MKISGFTVIRNASIMGYPVIPSIKSLLPLVDELVVGVGQSEDDTKTLIEQIGDPKIKIFDSFWDMKNATGGKILAEKTNEALARCSHNWCFYLQADEVLHEQDYPLIRASLEKYEQDPEVQGLLFRYVHFYGSYDVIAQSRQWYRNEIRIIKKDSQAQSFRDAQGFRIPPEKKLQVKASGASIYHYGWVKPPQKMGEKTKRLNHLWHGNKRDHEFTNFSYKKSYGLRKFRGTHPLIMQDLVNSENWNFDPRMQISDWTLKDLNSLASETFEKIFRHRIGEYKPYKLV